MTDQPAFSILENVAFLKKTTLFAPMRTSEIRTVAGIAEEMEFRDGDEIVREHDIGDALYIVKSGVVRISTQDKGATGVELARLTQGECFGDMSAFDAEVRSASVFAHGPCTLLKMNGADLIEVMLECPRVAIEFIRIFIRRLRLANATIKELSGREERESHER